MKKLGTLKEQIFGTIHYGNYFIAYCGDQIPAANFLILIAKFSQFDTRRREFTQGIGIDAQCFN